MPQKVIWLQSKDTGQAVSGLLLLCVTWYLLLAWLHGYQFDYHSPCRLHSRSSIFWYRKLHQLQMQRLLSTLAHIHKKIESEIRIWRTSISWKLIAILDLVHQSNTLKLLGVQILEKEKKFIFQLISLCSRVSVALQYSRIIMTFRSHPSNSK